MMIARNGTFATTSTVAQTSVSTFTQNAQPRSVFSAGDASRSTRHEYQTMCATSAPPRPMTNGQ
jgi:restriction endonuclease Mrr